MNTKYLYILFLLVYSNFGLAQSLELKKIMKGYDWVGHSPENMRWSSDSRYVYFDWKRNKNEASLYRYDVNAKKLQEASEKEQWLYDEGIRYNKKRTAAVFERNGDLFLWNIKKKIIQLTNTTAQEKNVRFSHDEQAILFEIGTDLYQWDLNTKQIKQYVEFVERKKSSIKILTEQEKWIEDEENDLFSIHKRKKEKKKKYLPFEKQVPQIAIGDKNVWTVDISPDKRFLTYLLSYQSSGSRTKVADYVTKKGYAKTLSARPKVGSGVRLCQFYIYDFQEKKKIPLKTDFLDGVYKRPDHFFLTPQDSSNNRANYVYGPIWSDDGKKAIVEIRATDNKDRWIALLDLKTGIPKQLFHRRDSAWLAGPGIGWHYLSHGNIGWLPDNKHIYFQTEESGWSHLCLINVETGEKKALTSGEWEVTKVELSDNKKYWYLTTSENEHGERQFYQMPILGGKRTRITSLTGNNQVVVSPDNKYLAVRNSFANQPWEFHVQRNRAKSKTERITFSQSKEFEAYNWRTPKFVTK